jgi:hypothetical protein
MTQAIDRLNAETAFEEAQRLQKEFWSALLNLEVATGIEVDDNVDLSDMTLDLLIEEAAENEDGRERRSSCNEVLEQGRIGKCDDCAADGKCRICGEEYPDGGDGYDGMCPSCADKAVEESAGELAGDMERDEK